MSEAMATVIAREFLGFSVRKLEQLSSRICDCLQRLSDEQVWWRQHDVQNAVGNLVLHLCGNVRQWIGHGVAGLPDVRRRDEEFAVRGGISRQELIHKLEETVELACSILKEVPPSKLLERTRVQTYEITVLEAIYHVVEHFAQHTGQILYVTKLLTGQDLGYYRHLSKDASSQGIPSPASGETTP